MAPRLSGPCSPSSGCSTRLAGDPDARLVWRDEDVAQALHVSVRLTYLAAAAVGAQMLFPAASAQAADVVVGSPLTSTYSSGAVGGAGTAANPRRPRLARMPARQSLEQSSSGASTVLEGGLFRLRVLAPSGAEKTFTGAGTSVPENPASTGIETFKMDLPIYAGDIVGVTNSNDSDRFGIAIVTGATYLGWELPLEEGVKKREHDRRQRSRHQRCRAATTGANLDRHALRAQPLEARPS